MLGDLLHDRQVVGAGRRAVVAPSGGVIAGAEHEHAEVHLTPLRRHGLAPLGGWSPLLTPRRQPTTCRPPVVGYRSILSLDLDARLPYGPDHGTTEREGGRRDRRSLGDRRGHRAAVREGKSEGGLRRPRRRAGQAGPGGGRRERGGGWVRWSAPGTPGGGPGPR